MDRSRSWNTWSHELDLFFHFLCTEYVFGFRFWNPFTCQISVFLMEHKRREIKFKTLMNWSPLNRPEVSTKLYASVHKRKKIESFLLPKVNTVFSRLIARGVYLKLGLVYPPFIRTRRLFGARRLFIKYFFLPFIISTGGIVNKEPNFNKIVKKCETVSPT